MTHEYKEQELVTLTRENYDTIKDGYDSKFEEVEKKLKEMEGSICIVELKYPLGMGERAINIVDRRILHEESKMYDTVKQYVGDVDQLKKDITRLKEAQTGAIKRELAIVGRLERFENSKLGKFLKFFGVKI